MNSTRADGRSPDQLRPVTITRNWLDHAEGSCLVEFGKTTQIFEHPVDQRTEDYISGRFG